jgi:hypothetical protein
MSKFSHSPEQSQKILNSWAKDELRKRAKERQKREANSSTQEEVRRARELQTLNLLSLFRSVITLAKVLGEKWYEEESENDSQLWACFTWIRAALCGEETTEEDREKVLSYLEAYTDLLEPISGNFWYAVDRVAKERRLLLERHASQASRVHHWRDVLNFLAVRAGFNTEKEMAEDSEQAFSLRKTLLIQSAPTGSTAPPVNVSKVLQLRDVYQGGESTTFYLSLNRMRRIA